LRAKIRNFAHFEEKVPKNLQEIEKMSIFAADKHIVMRPFCRSLSM
jgi:hypothetical protein